MHGIVISTMITQKQKKHKKKTDRNFWYTWALYNLSFLRMVKQRFRISSALNLGTHNMSLTRDVIACRISAAADVKAYRISAALDVKACRISATLDVKACRISAALDVKACRVSAALDVKPCRISASFIFIFIIFYKQKLVFVM